MSRRAGKVVMVIGLIACMIMWIGVGLSIAAIGDALSQAKVAIAGDISGVVAALDRALDIATVGPSIGLLGFGLFSSEQ